MSKIPVIGSIQTMGDVKRALYNILNYFEGVSKEANSPTPETKVTGLTIAKSKAINVDESWTLRGLTTNEAGNTLDDKKHVTIIINGTPVKLAVLK
jgi:hypothetical protein